MAIVEILAQIDGEISRLKQARAVLVASQAPSASKVGKQRKLTPDGRRRIAEAVKRRWALQKKAHR